MGVQLDVATLKGARHAGEVRTATMEEMMDGHMMGGMGLWILVWAIAGLAVLLLAVAGTIWLVRRTETPSASGHAPVETAEELLRRRYAAGEIDEDEYDRRRDRLA